MFKSADRQTEAVLRRGRTEAVSKSKSGNSALIWGDRHCKELKGSEVENGNCSKDRKLDEENRKKGVLQKLHACFGGSKEDNYAANLDSVSDLEGMFWRIEGR
ncbi:Transcription factor MTB3 [Camellia lanceoleosa]|uniref:Transcription factor MTB3 n=1 Tax=Camellia lanceoleosa TaxID=1840588 RepID=A0ACC0FZT0_9ERIC|nr:Transcription factor MTB3 [Camellia lanceoleosa]